MNRLLFFVYCSISIIALFFVSTIPLGRQISFRRKTFVFFFILIFTFFATVSHGQITTPFVLIGISLLLCLKSSNKASNIISFLCGYLSLVCMDYFLSVLADKIWGLSIQTVQQRYLIPFGVFYLSLVYGISMILRYLLHQRIRLEKMNIHKGLVFFIVSDFIICVTICVIGIVWGEKIGYPSSVIQLNAILFFAYFCITSAIFIIGYRITRNNERLNTRLIQYENLNTYTQEIERIYMDMRSFRHDYLDILSSLKVYIDTQNYEALNSYFYNNILTLDSSFKDADNKLGFLANLKIDELKSTIAAKLLYALEKGIGVNIEILEPITEINMQTVDLIRVIGIFIDNSIEATLNPPGDIQLALIAEETSVVFILENSCMTDSLQISSLCDCGVSSKGNYRGLGLYNAKRILDSYPNIIWDMTCSDMVFRQQLTIFNIVPK